MASTESITTPVSIATESAVEAASSDPPQPTVVKAKEMQAKKPAMSDRLMFIAMIV